MSLSIQLPSSGRSSACRRLTVLSVIGSCRLSRPINTGASGSSNRRPLSGPCKTSRVSTPSVYPAFGWLTRNLMDISWGMCEVS